MSNARKKEKNLFMMYFDIKRLIGMTPVFTPSTTKLVKNSPHPNILRRNTENVTKFF